MRVVLELEGNVVTNIISDGPLDLYIIDHGLTPDDVDGDQILLTQYQVTEVDAEDIEYLKEIHEVWQDGRDVAVGVN